MPRNMAMPGRGSGPMPLVTMASAPLHPTIVLRFGRGRSSFSTGVAAIVGIDAGEGGGRVSAGLASGRALGFGDAGAPAGAAGRGLVDALGSSVSAAMRARASTTFSQDDAVTLRSLRDPSGSR